MEIMNFRFNTKSFSLLFINLILLPIAITQLLRGYEDMKYYKKFVDAIHNYNAQNLEQARFLLQEALEIKEGDINATLLLGSIDLLQGEYDNAKKSFVYVKEFAFGEEGAAGSSGEYVCDIHLIAKKTKDVDNPIVYRDIESKLRVLIQNNQNFVDGYIARGHIFLLQARFYQNSNNEEKEKESFFEARKAFDEAQKKIKEIVSLGEMDYYGPSNISCHSLYQGLAQLSYWESQQLLKITPKPKPNSPEAIAIYRKGLDAVENYQRAFLYSIKSGKSTAQNINYCFGTLLSYSWLSEEQRKSLMPKAEFFIQHMNNFRVHVDVLYGSNLKGQNEWDIVSCTGYIHKGIGSSRFYLKDFNNAKKDFSSAIRERTPGSQGARSFISLFSINKGFDRFDIAIQSSESISRGYENNIESNILPSYEKTNTLTDDQFIIMNNYLAACYYGRVQKPKYMEKIAELMPVFQTMKFDVPDYGWLYGDKIIGNNLYFLAKGIKSKDEKLWKNYIIE